jgi:hypothetical protein
MRRRIWKGCVSFGNGCSRGGWFYKASWFGSVSQDVNRLAHTALDNKATYEVYRSCLYSYKWR